MEKQAESQKKMRPFTVRLPDDVYVGLKIEAAKTGKRLQQVVLERLTTKVM